MLTVTGSSVLSYIEGADPDSILACLFLSALPPSKYKIEVREYVSNTPKYRAHLSYDPEGNASTPLVFMGQFEYFEQFAVISVLDKFAKFLVGLAGEVAVLRSRTQETQTRNIPITGTVPSNEPDLYREMQDVFMMGELHDGKLTISDEDANRLLGMR